MKIVPIIPDKGAKNCKPEVTEFKKTRSPPAAVWCPKLYDSNFEKYVMASSKASASTVNDEKRNFL